MIRAIIELDETAGLLAATDEGGRSDAITDVLIEAFDTPDVRVLDVVEEGEAAWYRSERF